MKDFAGFVQILVGFIDANIWKNSISGGGGESTHVIFCREIIGSQTVLLVKDKKSNNKFEELQNK